MRKHFSTLYRAGTIAVLLGASIFAQTGSAGYTDFTGAFKAGVQLKKFVLIFFHDTGPNTDLIKPVVYQTAREAVIGHHVVFGDVDIAHDSVGLGMAKRLGLTRLPTISLFIPDAANIAEIGRLEGYQLAATIRTYLVQRMCDSIDQHHANAPASDSELTSACHTADRWRNLVSIDGHFSVQMPGSPKESRDDSKSGSTRLRTQTYLYEDPTGSEGFMVSYSDYAKAPDPAVALKAADISPDARIDWDRSTQIAGLPAREISGAVNGCDFELRVVFAGKRVYRLSFAGRDYLQTEFDAPRFFDSFRLVN